MNPLKIVMCAEGAQYEMGGVGLVAVPPMAQALAALGHCVVLDIFGPVIPGAEEFVTSDASRAFAQNLVAFSYPARGRYAFAPRAVSSVKAHIARADFVMLHSLYSFAVLIGYGAARWHRKKYGLRPHGVLAPFQRTVSAGRKKLYNLLAANQILNHSSIIFYTAVGEREEAAPLNIAAPSVIIPHGIALEPFAHLPPRGAFRQKYLNGFTGPLLLYLGRLNAKKGLDLLIQAMQQVHARLPDARLALVGAGDPPEFAAQVQAWIREANVQDVVVMPGLLIGDEKMCALADADVFVLPSYAENFSFALFEAMAARVPVVISDTLNFAPMVERAGAGRVVPRESAALANAIMELLGAPDTRQAMAARGAQLAAQYSWSAVGKQLERAILAVLQNEPLPRDLVLGTAPL
jgi:glycosyltransferase involved in cell wall biosynthesis